MTWWSANAGWSHDLRMRTRSMRFHDNAGRSIANLRLDPTDNDVLCASFARVAEPCCKQPDVFVQARHGTRAPHRALFRYFRQAFDAASTPEKRREVVERIVMFLMDGTTHVWGWLLRECPMDQRDIFEPAQQADGEEDVAESLFLMAPTPTNRARLIEAGRLDRQRSELRERHLLGATDPRVTA